MLRFGLSPPMNHQLIEHMHVSAHVLLTAHRGTDCYVTLPLKLLLWVSGKWDSWLIPSHVVLIRPHFFNRERCWLRKKSQASFGRRCLIQDIRSVRWEDNRFPPKNMADLFAGNKIQNSPRSIDLNKDGSLLTCLKCKVLQNTMLFQTHRHLLPYKRRLCSSTKLG